MKKTDVRQSRLEELRAMLSAYRLMTVEEVETTGWGDLEFELQAEVWLLAQDLDEPRLARLARAAAA